MEAISILIIVIIVLSILLSLMLDGYATLSLTGSILAIFLLQLSGGWVELALHANDLVTAPYNFEWYQLFTSVFLHGDLRHIIGNLLPIIFIGLPLESRIGSRRFIFIYLMSGLVGNLGFLALNWETPYPALGASGAIFGIVGALAFLYPRDRIFAPIGFIFLPVPAMVVALFWGLEQLALIFAGGEGIAYEAHVFGMLGGITFAYLLRKVWKIENGGKKEKAKHRFDIQSIEPFLAGKREKEIYETIKKEKGEIRDIWIEHLLPKLRCPSCGKKPEMVKGKLSCRCGYERGKKENNK